MLSDPKLPDNPIVFASPGFYKLTGYTSKEVLGRNCRFLQGPATDVKSVDVISWIEVPSSSFSGSSTTTTTTTTSSSSSSSSNNNSIIQSLVQYGYIQSQGGCGPFVGEIMTAAMARRVTDAVVERLQRQCQSRAARLC